MKKIVVITLSVAALCQSLNAVTPPNDPAAPERKSITLSKSPNLSFAGQSRED